MKEICVKEIEEDPSRRTLRVTRLAEKVEVDLGDECLDLDDELFDQNRGSPFDAYYQIFRFIWIATSLIGGAFGYLGTHGDFVGVFIGLVAGCVLGMILGFWLPIIAVLMAVSGVLWIIMRVLE